jgi:hypothetical protein
VTERGAASSWSEIVISPGLTEIPALPMAPAPPVVSVVRSVVSEGEGRGFLVSFPRASQPTSMTPAPPDLNRTVRNHRFHSCHVGRQRCRMERSDVAGHQGSGECAHEGHLPICLSPRRARICSRRGPLGLFILVRLRQCRTLDKWLADQDRETTCILLGLNAGRGFRAHNRRPKAS